jgi:hypothetical protein
MLDMGFEPQIRRLVLQRDMVGGGAFTGILTGVIIGAPAVPLPPLSLYMFPSRPPAPYSRAPPFSHCHSCVCLRRVRKE